MKDTTRRDNYQSLEPPDPKETRDFSSVHRCAFWDGLYEGSGS
jgi:hypothetical protein